MTEHAMPDAAPNIADLFAIMRTARSMRRLKPDPVPPELIRKILSDFAGRLPWEAHFDWKVGGMISAALRPAQSKPGTFSIARRCAISSRALASA